MILGPHLTRATALWCGVASLALGIAMAGTAIHTRQKPGGALHDAAAMAEELRANGAIVENYHQILGNRYHLPHPSVQPFRIGGFIAAGVLIAAGGSLLLKASAISSDRHPTE